MARSILEAHRIEVAAEVRPHGIDVLPATTLRAESGVVTLVAGDPGSSHVALALALGGRLLGLSGLVTIDQHSDHHTLQAQVALVDIPGVTEPDPGLGVRTVVGEELAIAGRHASPSAARHWLTEAGLHHLDKLRMRDLPAGDRITMMTGLAALREPTFMVLALPERLGGVPTDWFGTLAEVAASGIGVVVTASRAAATTFPIPATAIIGNCLDGEEEQP